MKISHCILIAAICQGILTSCIMVKFNTTGLYSGYSELSDVNKEKVVMTDTSDRCADFVFNEDNKIFSINGKQLLDCIKSDGYSIVYIWSPNCSGTNCVSLDYIYEKAESCGFEVYIIAEYLTDDMFGQLCNPDRKIFCINEKYYKTKYCDKYVRLFVSDIVGFDSKDFYWRYRYLIFKDGAFERGVENVDSLSLGNVGRR